MTIFFFVSVLAGRFNATVAQDASLESKRQARADAEERLAQIEDLFLIV